MAYRAVEIANEFLSLPGAARRITQMKLQKLTYIAHGWNWAINNEPLILDPVEAWAYGPVYRDLYNHTKMAGRAPIDRLLSADDENPFLLYARQHGAEPSQPYRAQITEAEGQVIRHVWSRYGQLSGIALSELTHQQGTPWFITYTEKGESQPIDDVLIREHYEQLADRVAA